MALWSNRIWMGYNSVSWTEYPKLWRGHLMSLHLWYHVYKKNDWWKALLSPKDGTVVDHWSLMIGSCLELSALTDKWKILIQCMRYKRNILQVSLGVFSFQGIWEQRTHQIAPANTTILNTEPHLDTWSYPRGLAKCSMVWWVMFQLFQNDGRVWMLCEQHEAMDSTWQKDIVPGDEIG